MDGVPGDGLGAASAEEKNGKMKGAQKSISKNTMICIITQNSQITKLRERCFLRLPLAETAADRMNNNADDTMGENIIGKGDRINSPSHQLCIIIIIIINEAAAYDSPPTTPCFFTIPFKGG